MAREVQIGGDGDLFIGEDKTIRVEVLGASEIPENIAAFAMTFLVRPSDSSGTTTLTKSVTVTGTYNANRNTNTQRAVVTLTDTDMSITAGTYRYSLKRTDDGSETIIAWGDFIVEQATQT